MSRTATNKTTGHAPSTLMLERMHEAATDLAILATATQGWRFINERNGTMLYEMAGRNLPPNVTTARKFGRGAGHSSDYYLVRAVTTVHSSVSAMLDLLHSSTTDEFRLVMKQVFQQHFENGVTLDKLTCTTPPPFAENPDAGADGARQSYSEDDSYSVNWLTLKAQAKLGNVENNRDFTLVSYQDAFSRHASGALERVGRGTARISSNAVDYQPQNRLVGVHVLSSVNFQEVPELPIPKCTDRLHFRNSGFVIEETSEPNVLRLSLLLSLLPTKATLKYARKYQRWLQTLVSCAGNLAHVLRPEVTMHCLSRLTWKQSDHCFMCLKMFRTFRRCHHCRFCGEAVCGACSSMVNMSGYEVTDGSGSTLAACAANALTSSQRNEPMNADFSQTGDVWQPVGRDGTDMFRSSSGTRNFREARGCSACVADLRHGLTASAVVKTRRNSGSSNDDGSNFVGENSMLARSKIDLSASNDDDEVFSYDSSDDVNYERRLGSIATYIPSEGGTGAVVEEYVPFSASRLGLHEPVDEFPILSEELQDKFPAADEPAPPRFRNVSDPDQLRRVRNVSDPDLQQRLKDKHSMVSMSTASSSFSRSSHDRYTNDNASQYSRGTNFSAMSDELSACDLSRDPDILALAGLIPRPSDDQFEPASIQRPPMPRRKNCEQVRALEEPEMEIEPEVAHKRRGHLEEDSFNGRVTTSSWSVNNCGDARYRSNTANTRDGLAAPQTKMLRPADVLRHRSLTAAASTRNPAATAPSSCKKNLYENSDAVNSSIQPTLTSSKQRDRPTPAEASNESSARFEMKTESSTTMAATVAAKATALTESTVAQQDQASSNYDSNELYMASIGQQGYVPRPTHQMDHLSASILGGNIVPNDSDRNNVIPLPRPGQAPANFVVFSDSRRKSIFMRADDGHDMIPLDF